MLSPALTVSVSFVLESMRNLGQTRTHKMTCCLSPQWLPVQVTQQVDRRLSQCKGQMERAWRGAWGRNTRSSQGQSFERVRSTDKAATRVSLQVIWSKDLGDNHTVV